jgi:hypothetical protein
MAISCNLADLGLMAVADEIAEDVGRLAMRADDAE